MSQYAFSKSMRVTSKSNRVGNNTMMVSMKIELVISFLQDVRTKRDHDSMSQFISNETSVSGNTSLLMRRAYKKTTLLCA